jgi:hypothetical protein
MLVKFEKCVVYSESPKFLAYKKGVEILEQNKKFNGATLEELFKIICKDDKQLATYFGYDNEKSLKIQDNHKIRDVKESLLNHSNIKRINNNPITLKWFDNPPPVDNQQQQRKQSAESDEYDKEKYPNQEKNNQKNFNESGLESTSDSSYSSFSEKEKTIKGFQMSPKGRIYEVTDKRYKELKDESEEGEDLN